MSYEARKYGLGDGEETRGSIFTRRALLQGGGFLVAAGAFSPLMGTAAAPAESAPASAPAISPVMEKLSAYMAAARDRALPGVVAEQAKYHILDTLCAMISGSQLPPGKVANRHKID